MAIDLVKFNFEGFKMKILMLPLIVIGISSTCFGEASTASIINSVGSSGTKMIQAVQGKKEYKDVTVINDVKNDKTLNYNTTNGVKFSGSNVKATKVKVKNTVKNTKTVNINTTNGVDF